MTISAFLIKAVNIDHLVNLFFFDFELSEFKCYYIILTSSFREHPDKYVLNIQFQSYKQVH